MVLISATGDAPRESFDVSVPHEPRAVTTDGGTAFFYEAHVTNFTLSVLSIRAVTVADADNGETLGRFDGAALLDHLVLLGENGSSKGAAGVTIRPCGRAILYVELTGYVPKRIRHIIDYVEDGQTEVRHLDADVVAIRADAPIVLSPPLAGGNWVAVHSPTWPRGHRRVIYTLDGKARIPGRYAIDWMGVDDDGRTAHGEPDRPANAIGYGAPVLAGADARVAMVRDGMIEGASILHNPKRALGEGAGNYVALDLGRGRYAFYEHLRPGSIGVKAGQRVRRGQPIGALGFSGDTTGPHLHLHVADGVDPLKAEGLPFAIDGYTQIGRYEDIGSLGRARWQAPGSARKSHEWPASNVVVRFGR